MSALSERRIDVFGGAISESADKQVLPVRIRRELVDSPFRAWQRNSLF
jgi:hypothetical protein